MNCLRGKLQEALDAGGRAQLLLRASIQKIFPPSDERDKLVSQVKPDLLPGFLKSYESLRLIVVHMLRGRVNSAFRTVEQEGDEPAELQDIGEGDSDTTILRKTEQLWSKLLERVKPQEIVSEWIQGPYKRVISSVQNAEVVKKAEEYAVSQFRSLYLARLKRKVKARRRREKEGGEK